MKLTFIRFEDDKSGGPYMPTCIFKHADHPNDELHITNSFYGAKAYFNPGPKVRGFDLKELTSDEVSYMWQAFDQNKKRVKK